MNKCYANKGVERNKKPLKNIVYEISISRYLIAITPPTEEETARHNSCFFKDQGFLSLSWWYQTDPNIKFYHGLIPVEELKEKLSEKQWAKFCQGKREFVIQRRINGANIPKK